MPYIRQDSSIIYCEPTDNAQRLNFSQLGKLESLAIYFDTDAESMAGLSHVDFMKKFTDQV